MPSTYTLIKGDTLTASAASYTFTAIPSTYTDLVIRASIRENAGGAFPNAINLTFNGSSASNYSITQVSTDTTTPGSNRYSNQPAVYINGSVNGSASTANTFSNVEIYIPVYALTQNKTFSASFNSEANLTTDLRWTVGAAAGLRSVTAAITSVTLDCGASLGVGTSFYLYGISKS
jgi:hypothetical protein